MLTFTTTSLPMNFCIRPPFNPWMEAYLYCCSHHYCQYLMLILPHLNITPILVVLGVVLMATSVPTTTVTIIRICLAISYIGHTTLRSSKRIFKLSNILYVPHITKPLLYVHKFYRDDNVYFKFHASVFYFKDLITKEVLLSDQSNVGLYVLFESFATSILKPIGLFASPLLLICGIVNWVILLPTF
jgi:hypothetical protein